MRVLIAPDKFRDALDATRVAETLARAVREAVPTAQVDCCPLSDGGEGTGEILGAALGARPRSVTVTDPLGRPCAARWWLVPGHSHAIVEMAEASGLKRLSPRERNPLGTSTYGTGMLMRVAMDFGCTSMWVAVGGSATVDGGAACLQALGFRMYDQRGRTIDEPLTPRRLTDVARLQPPENPPKCALTVLCDVHNPLLGPEGAAPIFAGQKGADAAAIRQLEEALSHWALLLADLSGRDVGSLPHGGAAGGLAVGLAAALNARLVGGFECVARCVQLEKRVAHADLVLTGEGRLDAQTVGGKVVAGVARLAARHAKPVVAFVGQVARSNGDGADAIGRALGLHALHVITPAGTPPEEALSRTAENLYRCATEYLRRHA